MKMIVGLGDPGTKYQCTKHNIGLMVVDQIAREHRAAFKEDPFEAEVAEFFHNGEKILLAKSQTLMNKSGRTIGPLMTYLGIYPEELVVIYDDLDLTVGEIRLHQKESAGGHNGIKSIISHLNTDVFDQIRMGIGRPEGKRIMVQHVFSPFSRENQSLIEGSIFQSVKTVECLIEGHSSVGATNQFN